MGDPVSKRADLKSATSTQLPDDFIDRVELARRFQLNPRTVRRMVERGELPLPCLGAGGRPRWLWNHVLAYCQKRHLGDEDLDRRRNRKLK